MSAVVCGKRSHFDELGSPPIAKRHRCGGNSPVRFSSRSNSPGANATFEFLQHLRALYPDMDGELVEKVLETCGHNLDAAIRSLNELRLSNDKPDASPSVQEEAAPTPQGSDWVELFVHEMATAKDMTDARNRATGALQSFEKTIMDRNASVVEAYQKENDNLKTHLQTLMKDNHILKRGLQIQHERSSAESEEKNKELGKLKQTIGQYQEQLKTLELNNYALSLHLSRAQGSSIPGHFHPDIF